MFASSILRSTSLTCHALQKFLGLAMSQLAVVPLLRLRTRFLQRDLNRVYSSPRDSKRLMALSLESRHDLRWICSLAPRQCVAPMWPIVVESCDLAVTTDASEFAWGIYSDGRLLQGRWSDRADVPEHINAKELLVLRIFLEKFLPPSSAPRNLLWRTDSTTAMAFVAHQGGTRSLPLLQQAAAILPLAHSLNLRILPVFLPSEENFYADAASRFRSLPDWRLRVDVFRRIVARWGLPDVDLFATTSSAQLPRFFAWGDAPTAEAYDALCQFWNFRLAYAFPPPALLPRVARKIALSSGTFLLVTPFWTAQKWFPLLLRLRVDDVLRLPLHDDLLVDLTTGMPPLVDNRLVVWRIFGGCAATASPTPPSVSSATAGVLLPGVDTTGSGPLSAPFYVPEDFLSLTLL